MSKNHVKKSHEYMKATCGPGLLSQLHLSLKLQYADSSECWWSPGGANNWGPRQWCHHRPRCFVIQSLTSFQTPGQLKHHRPASAMRRGSAFQHQHLYHHHCIISTNMTIAATAATSILSTSPSLCDHFHHHDYHCTTSTTSDSSSSSSSSASLHWG